MVYTNLLVDGRLVEQRTHWTLAQATEYADRINATGGDCRVYVREGSVDKAVQPA